MTYSRWCGDEGIRWTRGRAACLQKSQYALGIHVCSIVLTVVAEPLRGRAHLCSPISRKSMIQSVRTAGGYATQVPLPEVPSHDNSSSQRPTAAPISAYAPSCLTGVVSNVSALEARTTRKRRHSVGSFGCFANIVSIYTFAGGGIAKRRESGRRKEGPARGLRMRPRRAPFVWELFVMALGLTGVGRTCFFNCFDSFTCACLLVEVFSRSSRGTARRRSTRRVEPPVARRYGGRRAGVTYVFQTSSPSLSDTTSTSSKEIGMRGESLE